MADLVRDLAAYARGRRPGFLVVANNGGLLAARSADARRSLDAVVQESLTFGGRAGAAWEDGDAGGLAPDVSLETREALATLGLPVFTLDYAVLEEDARTARAASLARGFVPFVSRTPLDRLP
jgi:endo-alpha-1,4-polygalactosaminidase (GH114 family)